MGNDNNNSGNIKIIIGELQIEFIIKGLKQIKIPIIKLVIIK